ncbi:MAG: hypothetical protein J6Q48_06105 [Bacteroidaceae bacterium]|nr:hypothetical protein [Bacteroidaceae bacterium]
MGLKVTTDGKPVTVYRKEKDTQNGGKFTTYSIGISSKDKDGNWVNGYLDAQFKKGVEVAHKAKINISNSFYTVNEYNGKKYTKIFVMDFEVVDPGEVQSNDTGFMNIPDGLDEELPFA